MDEIIIDIDTEEAQDFLDFAGYRAKNLAGPLRSAGRALLRSIDATFATEGEWIGEFWPELNPHYQAWKEMRAPTLDGRTKMLHFTKTLRKAATSNSTLHVQGEAGELEYVLTEPFWGEIHQHGARWVQDGKERGIPARVWMKVTPELVDEWEGIFMDWLIGRRNKTAKGHFDSVPLPDLGWIL